MTSKDSNHIVSVIMSVYDGDKIMYLQVAVESILSQSYSDIEFIIVDDGLTNTSTIDYLQDINSKDKRIKILHNSANQGLAVALNKAVKASIGDFILRMDADDISPPDRISRLVDFMEIHPEIDVAGSFILEFSDENNIGLGKVVSYPIEHVEMMSCFLRRNPIAHASAIFRSSFFEKAGHYPLYSLRNEDTLLWLNGFKAGCRFANLPKVLYYVRHDIGSAGRRVGFRKSFSDFIDRVRVLIDLGGRSLDYLVAFAMLTLQNMPRSVYLGFRSLLMHTKN